MLPALNRVHSAVCLFALWLVCLCGCGDSTSVDSTDKDRKQSKNAETESERCRKKLAGAIRRLTPEILALQASPERSINSLNAWIASCAAEEIEDIKLTDTALSMLPETVRATAGRYTANDAAYIRDCLLLRDLTQAICSRSDEAAGAAAGTDAARVMAIFDWVIQNVSVLPDAEERVPLGLFDVLMTGRGDSADRAWIFAEALRQQQIDAVIVRSNSDPADKGGALATAPWLMAVFLDQQSFLFDVNTGMPVLTDGQDDILTALPAPISVLKTHERWKESSVQLVAQIAAFAPRMLVLQEQLAAEDSAILFEELTGGVSEILPLVERVRNAGKGIWTDKQISVWDYPEQQVVSSNALTEKQKQAYALLMRPFEAPFERKDYNSENIEDLTAVPEQLSPEGRQQLIQERLMENFARMVGEGTSEEKFGKPSNGLLKARIQQILGGTGTNVIQQLQQIRIASMQEVIRVRVPKAAQVELGLPELIVIPFPELIREVNQSSTGDSLYWTALCQMDRGEYGAAIITLMNYRRQYPEGKWNFPSMSNQALALLAQKRTDDARTVLKEADVDANPERPRVISLLQALAE